MAKRTPSKRRGRPATLTPQIAKKICAGVREGLPLKTAVGVAGVPYRTAKEWLQKGQHGDGDFVEFADDIEIARAEAQRRLIKRMLSAKEDPKRQRVLAHVFERLYPSAFDPNHSLRALQRQKLRAELNTTDQSGDVEVNVTCEPHPQEATGDAAVATDVAPGGDPQRT
jgi:hypothetical protein